MKRQKLELKKLPLYRKMIYFFAFIITLLISTLLTLFTKKIAFYFNIIDKPDQIRKKHKKNTPLLGGLAIFISFFFVLFLVKDYLVVGDLNFLHWIGFFAGACILIIGGILDDKYKLPAKFQIFFPIIAIFAVLVFGINIEKITNPLGDGYLYLDTIKIALFEIGNFTAYFIVLSDLIIILWLMGMIYTTKLLDGIDGLVTGITMIGALIIFCFTISSKYYQPDIALASIILAAACLGFLIFNWHPASIFLGEGGSLFLGYALGVLAIISGGKIAIALLVMGIPIMDVAWTIVRRLKKGKNPFKFADREHLHFKILDSGIGQRKTVLFYYAISIIFGVSALFLQGMGKIMALAILILLMMMLVIIFYQLDNKKILKKYD